MIAFTKETRHECCGCSACAESCPRECISMTADAEGFHYPEADRARCSGCGLCEAVCPVKHRPELPSGPPKAYAMRSADKFILSDSASGGAFTPLAREVLREGGAVFGAAFDSGWKVVHKMAVTPDEADGFRGSKYVQSDLDGSFRRVRELLEDGRKALFSGVPCQIAGLKNYLGREYGGLVCVDLVCHGVPSPAVWEKYKALMELRFGAGIEAVRFRGKSYGYHSGAMWIRFANGREYRGSARVDPMLKCFFKEAVSRPSCYRCAFKTLERESDLTLFDCWSVEKLVPSLRDDDLGYTAALSHTRAGEELLNRCAEGMEIYPVDVAALAALDGPMICGCAEAHPRREMFFDIFEKDSFEKAFNTILTVSRADMLIEKSKMLLHRLGLIRIIKRLKDASRAR